MSLIASGCNPSTLSVCCGAAFDHQEVICAIRSLWRHRASLIQMAAELVLHMQKALDQMNLQVHRVLNDITGLSGLRILDAILEGERIQ